MNKDVGIGRFAQVQRLNVCVRDRQTDGHDLSQMCEDTYERKMNLNGKDDISSID